MTSPQNRRKYYFANNMHREIFFLVFFASLIPMLISVACLYYLIFRIMAEQLIFPEAIVNNVFPAAQKVLLMLAIILPITGFFILIVAHKVSHKIIGPFDRMVRELGECVSGQRKGHLLLRKNDKFWPLVEKINQLIDQLPS